jgi:DNA repair protein RecN (Recombination protein N)
MLKTLRIENYAIIAKVHIDFDASLNIITGETGAGKSILLGALGLIMGQRSDSKVLYDKGSKCIVEAVFSQYPPAIEKLLVAEDLDVEDELIIRREISTSGRSRAFINDTPVKLDVLQLINQNLIDLNQQFNITDIQDKKFQLSLIDGLADNQKLLAQYRKGYAQLKEKRDKLSAVEQMESTQLKELDFIKFQHNELVVAALDGTDKTSMESELELLDKSEDITNLMAETAYAVSESDQNLKDQLAALAKRWSSFSSADPQLMQGYELMENIQEEFHTLYDLANNIKDKTEMDPSRLSTLRAKLDSLYSLEKKHGVNTIEELLQIQTDLELRLNGIENRSEIIAQLQKEILDLDKSLRVEADTLSQRRAKVFPKIQKAVNKKLNELGMGSAEIKVQATRREDLSRDGLDNLDILFKANKGNEFLPIRKVASGGETSRLMLSLKASVADKMSLPTMIFDEIDTGVSGEVAGKMGDIIRSLANKHQLICITHSPQVSARAVQHLFVYKEETKSRTITHVKVLSKKERILEIAKMLSGDPPSSFALDNAKDLLSV